MKRYLLFFLAVALLPSSSWAVKIWGPPVELGDGEIRVFVEADENGDPESLGVGFTRDVLEGLPEHEPQMLVVPLPSIVALPPYNHAMVDWMPHGHDPNDVYGLPHFDFHFYMISPEERLAIGCGVEDLLCLKMPEPTMIPPFYVPTPAGVPAMGWHWVDSRSPELNGEKFTSTYIYGFYDGQLHFVEPMITREFILATTEFEKEVPLPEMVSRKGWYPQKYSLEYSEAEGMYYVTLKELVQK